MSTLRDLVMGRGAPGAEVVCGFDFGVCTVVGFGSDDRVKDL